MKIEKVITTRRHARADLPYEKVMDALKRIAEEEGIALGDLNWRIGVPDYMAGFLIDDEAKRRAAMHRVWLYLDEDAEVVKSSDETIAA